MKEAAPNREVDLGSNRQGDLPIQSEVAAGAIAAIVSANVSFENGVLIVNGGEVERQVRALYEGDGINWKAEWEATTSWLVRVTNAARPFADCAVEFSACGDGQPIGVKAASGRSDLSVGDLRALEQALVRPTPASSVGTDDRNAGGSETQ